VPRGGKRAGAGRKPKQAAVLRRKFIEDKQHAAEDAFAFLVEVMNNPEAALALRVESARQIQDRVWGKPRQAVDMQQETPATTVVIHRPDAPSSDG
jgi:hypothetical protein